MAANTIMKLLVSLGVDVGEFKQGLAGAEGAATNSAAKISQSFQQAGKAMMGIGAGMTAALSVPIAMFLVDAVKEAGEAEVSLAMVENTIKATGSAAGVTAEECKKFADSMSLLTGFTDDAIMESQNLLLTFTAIGKDIFPRASRATLDLARQFKMDLGSASIMVGKALQDPIMGLTAMRRVGVSVTAEQKTLIESMMAVGDIAGAQGIIFEVLEGQVAGAAEAYGKTFPGQVAIFKQSLDNLKESLGKAIIPLLIDLIKIIQPVVQAFAAAPPWVQKLILVFLGLVAIAGPIIGVLGAILTGIGMLFAPGTLAGLATLVSVISGTVIPAIVAIGTAIWGALLPLLPVIALIAAAVLLVYLLWKNWDELGVIITQLGAIIKWEFNTIASIVKTDIETIKANWKIMTDNMRIAWTTFTTNIKTAWTTFITNIQTAWTNAVNAIQGFFITAFTNISNFFNSVRDSIVAGINYIIQAVQNLISWLSGIEIPSPLMPGSPTPFEMGLRGIADAMRELTSFNSINIGMPGLSGFAPMTPAPATGGTVNNINITVGEIKNRNDMDYLAQEILRRITKA